MSQPEQTKQLFSYGLQGSRLQWVIVQACSNTGLITSTQRRIAGRCLGLDVSWHHGLRCVFIPCRDQIRSDDFPMR